MFDNPAYISMSDQSLRDVFDVKMPTNLYSANGLPLNTDNLSEDGSAKSEIQPMVDTEDEL